MKEEKGEKKREERAKGAIAPIVAGSVPSAICTARRQRRHGRGLALRTYSRTPGEEDRGEKECGNEREKERERERYRRETKALRYREPRLHSDMSLQKVLRLISGNIHRSSHNSRFYLSTVIGACRIICKVIIKEATLFRIISGFQLLSQNCKPRSLFSIVTTQYMS